MRDQDDGWDHDRQSLIHTLRVQAVKDAYENPKTLTDSRPASETLTPEQEPR